MAQLLYRAALVLCPIAMTAVMWSMARGGASCPSQRVDTAAQRAELDSLGDEVAGMCARAGRVHDQSGGLLSGARMGFPPEGLVAGAPR